METRIERGLNDLFFCDLLGMSTGSGCRFGVRFFCIRQSRFYYISVVPVVCDDFTIRVSGEPSRASDERNDFLILTNERPTRFYYLFRGRTSRTIFLYWPTIAILIFFEEVKRNPVKADGIDFRAVRRRSRIRQGLKRLRGRFWGLRPEPLPYSYSLLAICYKFDELVRLKIRVPDILEQDSE